jgi:dTDP-4-amino-4,6-dideoxygalactose transaminase
LSVPFVDLGAIHDPIRAELLGAIEGVVSKDGYILGPEVAAFETEVADYLGVAHAIGVSSGTDALLVALMALDVGAGDEVITSPYTFFATGGAIARVGATPVFVDVEPDSLNLDPSLVEAAITPQTRAIVPVHIFGRSADMTALCALACANDLPIIEDAAQAIGATWDGAQVGTIGRVGCFSFFPAKNLGCFGDGGLVTTQDAELADRLKRLRKHGGHAQYHHQEVGGNFRLDALQAAVLRVKLPHLEAWTEARITNAAGYQERFEAAGLLERLTLPASGAGRHVYNQYVVRVAGGVRDAVRETLRASGVGCAVYYPVPLHQQPCFQGLNTGALAASEAAAMDSLALPIAPGLTPSMQDEVVEVMARALSGSAA